MPTKKISLISEKSWEDTPEFGNKLNETDPFGSQLPSLNNIEPLQNIEDEGEGEILP